MTKRKVFYSFHYDDSRVVSQVKNMGILEGNPIATGNNWEKVKRGGRTAIEQWINNNMEGRSCIIVLIGSETANRKYVQYEIQRAWNTGKGLVGIYIHNLKDTCTITPKKGENPFENFCLPRDSGELSNIVICYPISWVDKFRKILIAKKKQKLSDAVKCYNPNPNDAYNDIANNISHWIEEAINIRKNY